MALFKKEKRISDRERLLGQELKHSRYSNLADALINEVSLGSQDSKFTRVTLPDEREIIILTADGQIILARDSHRPVILSDFLYWTDLSASAKSTLLLLANDTPLNENLLSAIALKEPDALPVIHKAILDSTHEALLYLHRNFESYESIDTDLFRNPDVVKQLSPQGIDLLEVAQIVESNDFREDELRRILAIADVAPEDLQLVRDSQEKSGTYLPEKRFVLAAAEAEANLADTYAIASGFRWVNVLQRLHELVEEDLVNVKITVVSDALPDEIVIQRPHEVIFHLTLDVDEPLDDLVESVFSFSGDIDLAKSLSEKNTILEERIFEIEDWIIRELATEEYEDFDDLPEDFQISLRGLIMERREINEKRQQFLERLASLIIDDVQSTEDELLREKIDLKLRGISLATDKLPASHESVENSGFHLAEDKPEFNFNDGRIVQAGDGESAVEHLEEISEEEFTKEEEQVDLEEMIKLALEENPLSAPETREVKSAPVDLDLLDEHIARLANRRKRR